MLEHTVGTRARHTYIACTHTYTHTHTHSVSTNHAGEQNFWYMQADCVNNRPVKQYIVRGPFVTASQTTQNNKPKLTKRCTPRSASLPPSRPVSLLWSRDELPAFKLFVFCWNNTVIFHWLIYYIYMQNICVVFRVKCEEWQVGCHTYYYYFGRVYRCNFHFNFRQCNMILWS